jgi:glycosyltransferase involved in cell wall biosynthesis
MPTPRPTGPHVVLTHGWGLGTPSGVARHVQELARHLALAGARVTVVCVSTAGYSRFPRPELAERLHGRALEAELAQLGVEVVRVAPHPLHWMLDGRPVRRALARLFARAKPDAVLGFYNEAAYLPELCRAHGVRFGYIATWLSYRMALAPERSGTGLSGALKRHANRRFVVEPYRAAEVLFANSEFTRRELVDVVGCDPARIHVTHLGVRPQFLSIPRETPARIERLLFFGRLVREKGIGDALAALGALARQGRSFTLRVIGSGNAEHVRHLVREHGLADKVELLPHQDDAGLARELARAQLAVLPSHSESFGLSIAEAQAAGLPVVAYAAGSVPEVVADGQTAWLAPLGDIAALTSALTSALDSPAECHARGLAGRERVARLFRWDKTAERVLAGLQNLGTSAGARRAA